VLGAESGAAEVVAVEEARQVVGVPPLLVYDLEPGRRRDLIPGLQEPVAEIHVLGAREVGAGTEPLVEAADGEQDVAPAREVGGVADPVRVDDFLPDVRTLDVEDAHG